MDPELMQKCVGVTTLPDRPLGMPESVRLWAQDRASLGDCAPRHNALVDSVDVLQRRKGP